MLVKQTDIVKKVLLSSRSCLPTYLLLIDVVRKIFVDAKSSIGCSKTHGEICPQLTQALYQASDAGVDLGLAGPNDHNQQRVTRSGVGLVACAWPG